MIELKEDSIIFSIDSKDVYDLPFLWFRDNCQCDECRITETQEKQFLLNTVPLDIKPVNIDSLLEMMMNGAIAYYRTSSAQNVGEDKDSKKRQRAAVEAYAKSQKIQIVSEFYDTAVAGKKNIEDREAMAELLLFAEEEKVSMVLVESADRFARDLMVQEIGFRMLKDKGIHLVPVNAPDLFIDGDPTRKLIRQVLGAVAEFEKENLVLKLRAARQRKKRLTGEKVEGRKSVTENYPELETAAKRISRRRRNGKPITIKGISEDLHAEGFTTKSGGALSTKTIWTLLNTRKKF